MPLKFRRPIRATGGIIAGSLSNAATIDNLLFGSACINCPSAASYTTVVPASLAITNVVAGDHLFVTANGSVPGGMQLVSACCITGGISASWYNAASVDQSASADVPVNYLILR